MGMRETWEDEREKWQLEMEKRALAEEQRLQLVNAIKGLRQPRRDLFAGQLMLELVKHVNAVGGRGALYEGIGVPEMCACAWRLADALDQADPTHVDLGVAAAPSDDDSGIDLSEINRNR